MADERDEEEELEDEDESEETEDTDAESEDEESSDDEDAVKASSKDKSEKRIRDLQSKLDKATAALAKQAKAGGEEGKGEPKVEPELDPAVRQMVDELRDGNRERVYESDPRFKSYRLGVDAIAGESRSEMAASAKALSKLIDRVESSVRNEVLREHGFAPAPRDGAKAPRSDYGAMTKEAFDRLVEEAIAG